MNMATLNDHKLLKLDQQKKKESKVSKDVFDKKSWAIYIIGGRKVQIWELNIPSDRTFSELSMPLKLDQQNSYNYGNKMEMLTLHVQRKTHVLK